MTTTTHATIRYFILIGDTKDRREALYHHRCSDYTAAFKFAMEKAREHQGKVLICRPAKNQEMP